MACCLQSHALLAELLVTPALQRVPVFGGEILLHKSLTHVLLLVDFSCPLILWALVLKLALLRWKLILLSRHSKLGVWSDWIVYTKFHRLLDFILSLRCISIHLAGGQNRICVWVRTDSGAKSLRELLIILFVHRSHAIILLGNFRQGSVLAHENFRLPKVLIPWIILKWLVLVKFWWQTHIKCFSICLLSIL